VSRRLVLFACALGVSFAIAPGVLASLARPCGNLTGLSLEATVEVSSKYLELLQRYALPFFLLGFLLVPLPATAAPLELTALRS
jgi:hypothetical protein